MTRKLSTRIFSHEFKGFRGIRETQSELHPDHRYVRTLSNVVCHVPLLAKRFGASVVIRLLNAVTGHGSDDTSSVLCYGGNVAFQSGLLAWPTIWSDITPHYFEDDSGQYEMEPDP